MDEFLRALLQFPTVVFAAFLVVSLFYWGLVIAGAAHINPVHGAEGALKGAAHAVDPSHVVAGKAGALTEALAFLGLTKVPITISFSLFSLFSWFISIAARQALDPVFDGTWPSAAAATAVAVVGGFLATGLVTKPISGIFAEDTRVGPEGLAGRVVKVTTEVADSARGQGEIDDGAGGIVVQIRTAPGVVLRRGEEAVVIELDEKNGVWLVEPQRTLVPTEAEQLAAPVEPVEVPSTRGRS